MKWLSLAAMLALSAFLVTGSSGCKKGEQGTANAGGEDKYTVTGPKDTNLKVGDNTTIKVSVTRKKGYDGPVEVSMKGAPDKVTITPEKTTIGKDNDSAEFTLKAANDATAKDDVPVTVHTSGGGASKDVTFKLSIKGKT